MKGNTYAIGDIHGALKALVQLIDKIALQKNDKLIFIGDYVDGWSESAQVIDYLMDLKRRLTASLLKAITIPGVRSGWTMAQQMMYG